MKLNVNITAMAMSKSEWESKVENLLLGAFGEYCKLRFAQILKVDHIFQFDHWDKETSVLLQKVEEVIFNRTTTTKFNRSKALKVVFKDMSSGLYGKMREAKNEFGKDVTCLNRWSDYRLHIDIVTFDDIQFFNEMLETFSPRIVELLNSLNC